MLRLARSRPAWRARVTASSSPISRRRRATCREPRTRSPTPSLLRLPSGRAKACPRTRKGGSRRRRDGASSTLRADGAPPIKRRKRSSPDRLRIEGGRRRAGRDPGSAPRAHVRLRPSGDRGVHTRAVDVADDLRAGRGGDRFGLSGFAGDNGPAPLAREGENPPRRRAVQDSRAGGFARTARGGAGGDLRRFFAWLGGSVLRRSAWAQPCRGGDLARPRRRHPHSERARGDGTVGADALRPFAPRGATRRFRDATFR